MSAAQHRPLREVHGAQAVSYTLHCDRPGCLASVRGAVLTRVYETAIDMGWQVEPAIAPLRHFCPAHHVGEADLERAAAVGIRRPS